MNLLSQPVFSPQLGGDHADRGVGHTIALPWPNLAMESICAAAFCLEIMAEVGEEAENSSYTSCEVS